MSTEEKYDPIEPWIDPEIELSLISMLLGESSEFESAELMKKMKKSPEIRIFYERMSSAHEFLNQVSREDLSEPNEEWLMSEERYDALIEMFGSSEPVPSVHEKEFKITDHAARIRPQNYIENAIRRIAKHYKSILLGTAVGLTSLIMIGLSYWVIKPSFNTDSAKFVIADDNDEMIGAEWFQQSVSRKNVTPSSRPNATTNQPEIIELAAIKDLEHEDLGIGFSVADFKDQRLGESAQKIKENPNSNLSKSESKRSSSLPEKTNNIAGDPFSSAEAFPVTPENNSLNSTDDPFASPEPTPPSLPSGLAKKITTKTSKGQTLRGRVEIAGQANKKGKQLIDEDKIGSEQLRRTKVDKESKLKRESGKRGIIAESREKLDDKKLFYSESEVTESAGNALEKIDSISGLEELKKELEPLEEKLNAASSKEIEYENETLFFNSDNGVANFKTPRRNQLNAKIEPGRFGAYYGYSGNKASEKAELGGGFVDGKVHLIDNTEEQLQDKEAGYFFSGKQKEAPFARDQVKSNLTRKSPSKPKQKQPSMEEEQAEINDSNDAKSSDLWFGKTAGQQQGSGQERSIIKDRILAAVESEEKKIGDSASADTGGVILKNDADNDFDIQLSTIGGTALKKKRLAREGGSRSDTDGAETSILGRRPQPIVTSGGNKKAQSPVTGINNEPLNTETASRQLKRIDLSQEKTVKENPFSTFSLHVSDVSFKLAKTSLLEKSQWPAAEKIRPEEFVNAFDYGDPPASIKEKISCRLEQSVHPFLQQRNLLRVSMRTASTGRAMSRPLSLTVLLDKSGSMEREDREGSVLRAVEALSSHLTAQDTVTMISFARKPRLIGDRIPGNRSSDLIRIVKQTPSEGGTNLEEAINLANQVARRQFVENGINRIVLITDGAANLGDADPESLRDSVIRMRQEGIAFDACGVGAEGINDRILESLTRKGDGRYYFLDRPEDADSGFVRQLAGALRPAASNVKVQIKFNPDRVISYKLTGFEKHRLKKEDFRDDSVDAAELTSAEAGVALYHFQADPNGSGDVGQVFVRFQEMATGNMVERSWAIPYEHEALRLEQSKPSMQLAAIAGMFAEKIRSSPIGETIDLEEMRTLSSRLRNSYGKNKRVSELISMIEKASQLSQ